MGLKGLLKRSAFAGLAAGALSLSVVAVTPATSGAATKASSSSGGTATMALDENLAGLQHQHVGRVRVRAPGDHEHGLAAGLHHQQQARSRS